MVSDSWAGATLRSTTIAAIASKRILRDDFGFFGALAVVLLCGACLIGAL